MEDKPSSPILKRESNFDEDESRQKKIKLYENDDSDEESHIARLFDKTFDTVRELLEVSDEDMRQSIEDVMEAFRFKDWHWNKWTVDFSKNENLCAYFYLYFAQGVGSTRNRVGTAIDNCAMLKTLLRRSGEINIVSVGGGSGSDFFGFCSAIYEKIGSRNLFVTIADNNKRFESCLNITRFLAQEGHYGNISNLFQIGDVCSKFVKVDITGSSYPEDFIRDLKNADIILMKSVLSILNTVDVPKAIKLIQDNIKEGGMLLSIDSPFEDFPELKNIYKPEMPCSNQYEFKGRVSKRPFSSIRRKTSAEIAVFVKLSEVDNIKTELDEEYKFVKAIHSNSHNEKEEL